MLEFARNASILKLWQTEVTFHAVHNDAILYIVHFRIIHQTTQFEYTYIISQASLGIKLACNKLALALLFVSGWLSLCIRHQYTAQCCALSINIIVHQAI